MISLACMEIPLTKIAFTSQCDLVKGTAQVPRPQGSKTSLASC